MRLPLLGSCHGILPCPVAIVVAEAVDVAAACRFTAQYSEKIDVAVGPWSVCVQLRDALVYTALAMVGERFKPVVSQTHGAGLRELVQCASS